MASLLDSTGSNPSEVQQYYTTPRLSASFFSSLTGAKNLSDVSHLQLQLNTDEHNNLDQFNVLLPNLTSLTLTPGSFVSSFRDFGRSLNNIRELSLHKCGVVDIDGLENCKKLIKLNLAFNQISDLSALSFHPSLQDVDLSYNKLSDLDCIDFLGSIGSLRTVALHHNPLYVRKHYRAIVLARCPQLSKLDGVSITPADRRSLTSAQEDELDSDKHSTVMHEEHSYAIVDIQDTFVTPSLDALAIVPTSIESTQINTRKKEYMDFLISQGLTNEEAMISISNVNFQNFSFDKNESTKDESSPPASPPASSPTIQGVPSLQLNRAFSSELTRDSPSPTHSPSFSPSPTQLPFQSPSALSYRNQQLTARPSSSHGARPPSSHGVRPPSSGRDAPSHRADARDEQVPDAASELTYGSDSLMCGNFTQAVRNRVRKNSISLSTNNNASTSARPGSSSGSRNATAAIQPLPVKTQIIPTRSPSSSHSLRVQSPSSPSSSSSSQSRSSTPHSSSAYQSAMPNYEHLSMAPSTNQHVSSSGSSANHADAVADDGSVQLIRKASKHKTSDKQPRTIDHTAYTTTAPISSSTIQRQLSGTGAPTSAATKPVASPSSTSTISPTHSSAQGNDVVFVIGKKKPSSSSSSAAVPVQSALKSGGPAPPSFSGSTHAAPIKSSPATATTFSIRTGGASAAAAAASAVSVKSSVTSTQAKPSTSTVYKIQKRT